MSKEEMLRAAVLTALKALVASEVDAARTVADQVLRDLHTETGATSVVIALPDGTKVATLSLSDPETKPRITDLLKFVSWVKANRPDEIVTTEAVRASYEKALLESLEWQDGTAVDSDGVIVDGVGLVTAEPTVSLRYKAKGKDAIAAAYRAGELAGVAELTS